MKDTGTAICCQLHAFGPRIGIVSCATLLLSAAGQASLSQRARPSRKRLLQPRQRTQQPDPLARHPPAWQQLQPRLSTPKLLGRQVLQSSLRIQKPLARQPLQPSAARLPRCHLHRLQFRQTFASPLMSPAAAATAMGTMAAASVELAAAAAGVELAGVGAAMVVEFPPPEAEASAAAAHGDDEEK